MSLNAENTEAMKNLKNELNKKLGDMKPDEYLRTLNNDDERLLSKVNNYLELTYTKNPSKKNIIEVCDVFGIDINDVYVFKDEQDSTRRTFYFYEIVYNSIIGKFKYDITDSYRRCIRYSYDKPKSILLGGDVIFNFKEKKCRPFIQFQRKNIVKNSAYSAEIRKEFENIKVDGFFEIAKEYEKELEPLDKEKINQLIICRLLTHSLINYSLMPITGALNITKQNYGNDRFDKFVYMINCFYEEMDKSLTDFSQDNGEELLKFLDSFGNNNEGFGKYMSFFYQFEYKQNLGNFDAGLVDDFLESRKMSFHENYNTLNYLKLAFRFWSYRLKKISVPDLESNDYKIKSIIDEIKWTKELLDEWCKQDEILDYTKLKEDRDKIVSIFQQENSGLVTSDKK